MSLFGKGIKELVDSADRRSQEVRELLSSEEMVKILQQSLDVQRPEVPSENPSEPSEPATSIVAAPLDTLVLTTEGTIKPDETTCSAAISSISSCSGMLHTQEEHKKEVQHVKEEPTKQEHKKEKQHVNEEQPGEPPQTLLFPLEWSQVRYIQKGKMDIRNSPIPTPEGYEFKGYDISHDKQKVSAFFARIGSKATPGSRRPRSGGGVNRNWHADLNIRKKRGATEAYEWKKAHTDEYVRKRHRFGPGDPEI